MYLKKKIEWWTYTITRRALKRTISVHDFVLEIGYEDLPKDAGLNKDFRNSRFSWLPISIVRNVVEFFFLVRLGRVKKKG